ncbi:formylglycine-generating enzyme family protein [Verrucomicrobiaceae bacterium 227]
MKSSSALLAGFTLSLSSLLADDVKSSVTILPEKPATLPAPEQLELSQKIHALIVKTAQAEAGKAYEVKIPKADNKPLKLLPIPGGEFQFGGKKTVKIAPFWMSETEITWAHYNPFWQNDPEYKNPRNKDGSVDLDNDRYSPDLPDLTKTPLVDAISQPTTQVMDMFLSGQFQHTPKHPAMDMTNHAASKFCQWLSAQTGHFYRLPTEAEWEYACRAGTTTTYSFGDDVSKLGEYAWFVDNGEFTYHEVAQKKPNPWGLYDMHGNVAEWTIDGFEEDALTKLKEGVTGPWNFPTKRYPRVIRGGSADDDAELLQSSARKASSPQLKYQDPQIPKSVWYHTDGQFIGLRIIRPVDIPSAEEMHLFWNTDARTDQFNKEDL